MSKKVDLLPLGSVVLPNTEEKRLMIIGYYPLVDGTNVFKDYRGVIYPQGDLGPESRFAFDHEDITEVFFRGYKNSDWEEFVGKMQAENKE